MRERPRTWQQAERRALVADLVRTQNTLQARTEQLQTIFASRWYRLARFAWRLRRGSIFRKAGPPRMAGEDSFARPLGGDMPAEEAEVRLVPAPNGDHVAVDLERRRWLAEARMPGLEKLRVAAILDETTEACLAPECELETGFGVADWRERLEARPPHLLLVESAWAGNGGGWRGGVAPPSGSPQAGLPALRELVSWCRERDIPSAFWATQDPLGFDRFAAAASLCDHIFTVDSDRVPAYRQLPDSTARTVTTLPFAAQPCLHNPIAAEAPRFPEVAYAGAYDAAWPGERQEELFDLLEAAQRFGLVIYERGTGEEGQGQRYPPRFLANIEGRLSYGETIATYKRHRLFLAANSSADSPTAFSRQVFELLACGTPVLSTPNPGIEAILGDLVPTASGQEEAGEQLELLLGDDRYRHDLARSGRRYVLGAHTYHDRLAELVATAGFDVPAGAGEETAVLIAMGAEEELDESVESLLGQSMAPNEVLVGLAGGASAERELDRLRERFPGARIRTLSQRQKAKRSERLRELARLAAAPWVVPIAPTLRYGPHHLRDLVSCTRFAEARVIGFGATAGTGGGSHCYVDAVPPHAALAARAVVAERGWPRDEAAMRSWFAEGIRIYAGEPYIPEPAPGR
ncbi:MAG TPA: glycosyltransferase [Solirubrobacterales bacterium]